MTDPITIAEAQGFELLKLQPPAVGDDASGKRPVSRNGDANARRTSHRLKDGTPSNWIGLSYDEARQWTDVGGNVGMLCGGAKRIIVIDVDGEVSPDLELPPTPTVRTHKGEHKYYQVPEGVELDAPNKVRIGDTEIDIRYQGGYVVAPGSVHHSGTCYEWADFETPDDLPYAPVPQWVIDAINEPTKPERKPVELPQFQGNDDPYIAGALRRATEAVATATEGTRNTTLNREAYSLAGLGLTYDAIAEALTPAAQYAGGQTDTEIAATIRSGFTQGATMPRERPERTRGTETPQTPERGTGANTDGTAALDNVTPFVAGGVTDDLPVERETLPYDQWGDVDEVRSAPIINVFAEGLKLGTLGIMAAAGGTGKSFLALELALSVALGRPLVEGFTPAGAGSVLCAFGEDDRQIVSRRLKDISDGLGVPWDETCAALWDGRLNTIAGRSEPLLAPHPVTGVMTPTNAYRELQTKANTNRHKLIIVDPLISWAGLEDENSNAAMQVAARMLIELAEASGGAVLVLHHTNKAGNRSGEHSQDNARGASSLGNASRWAISMRTLDENDAKDRGIAPEEAVNYCQAFITKNSYAPRDGRIRYLRRDGKGVLSSVDLVAISDRKVAEVIAEVMRETGANLTTAGIIQGKQPKEKEFRETIRTRADCTVEAIARGLDYGIKNRIFEQRKHETGGSGRPCYLLNLV